MSGSPRSTATSPPCATSRSSSVSCPRTRTPPHRPPAWRRQPGDHERCGGPTVHGHGPGPGGARAGQCVAEPGGRLRPGQGRARGRARLDPARRPAACRERGDRSRRRCRPRQHGLRHAGALRASRPHPALRRPDARRRDRPRRGGRGRSRPARRRQGHRAAARGRDGGRGRLPGGRGLPAQRRLLPADAAAAAVRGAQARDQRRRPDRHRHRRQPVDHRRRRRARKGHRLRLRHDAILVGSGTALADDPMLTCRLPGLEHRSPVRVVLDRRLRLPPDEPAGAQRRRAPRVAVHAAAGERDRGRALQAEGVTLFPADRAASPTRSCMHVLATLAEQGITRVLVEGGATLATAFLRAGLVDRLYQFDAPLLIGARWLSRHRTRWRCDAPGRCPALAAGRRSGCWMPTGSTCWSRCAEAG